MLQILKNFHPSWYIFFDARFIHFVVAPLSQLLIAMIISKKPLSKK